jgi:acrylyl-CoA reductase (NADPH)
MSEAIRAYRVFEGGRFGEGRFAEMRRADLDEGNVVVRSLFASVNYKDALTALGKARIASRFPVSAGIDVCGRVEESGDARFRPGDHVIAHGFDIGAAHDGGYQETNRFPGDWLVRLPAGLTPYEAMAIGVAGFTSALAVELMELNGLEPKSGKVLVNGATGGAASIAIDLLAARGYQVTALTGKQEAAEYLRTLGATEVIDRKSFEFGTRPLEKPMWAGAVDSLGGEQLAWLARTMQRDGVIASFGNAAGNSFEGSVLPFILRGVRLIGIYANSPIPLRERIWQRLASDLKPRHLERIGRRIAFETLPAAFDDLIAARATGRMVVDFSLRQ